MKSKIQTVKGTRDFYPEQMALRNWLYGNMRAASQMFGYQEYDGPFIETLGLYAAKSGDELVKKQSFVFADRGGDEITLRPELTPSLARMVATRQAQLPRPIRWWSFGPMWRYEQPQKGRSREFYQWNVDLLGVENPAADAELVGIAATFFGLLGLTAEEVKIQYNNRRLMESEVKALNLLEKKAEVFRLIDRREKMRPAAWEAYAAELGLSEVQIGQLTDLLGNRELWQKSEECLAFVNAVNALGVGAYLEFEPTIVRGLDYYTGIVIEARDRENEFRAILGGGRYDNLVGDVGGDRLPGLGFAMGDMVVGLVAQKYGKVPALRTSPTDVVVTTFDQNSQLDSLKLAGELRAAGLKTEWYPEPAKLEKQLKYADLMGARVAVIIGPEEAAKGIVTLKDLATRDQRTFQRAHLVVEIQRLLGSKP